MLGSLCVDWQPYLILVWHLTSTQTHCTCSLCSNALDVLCLDWHWKAQNRTCAVCSLLCLIWLQASQPRHRLARSSAAVARREGARLPSAELPSSPPGYGPRRGGWAPSVRQPEAPGSAPSRKRCRSQAQASSRELKASGTLLGRAAGSSRGHCKAVSHATVPTSGSLPECVCTGALRANSHFKYPSAGRLMAA